MQSEDAKVWRKCSSCKKTIDLGASYYVCSVSTCNSQRTGYVFCSVPCFEVHLPSARHKDAAAIEAKAPTSAPKRTIVGGPAPQAAAASAAPVIRSGGKDIPREVLIIASRLKDYIHARSEMNTSAQVMDVLSDFVRVACDRAIDNARAEGRKTVLDRDFTFLKNP